MPPHTTPPTARRWRIYDQINNKWSDRVFSLDELKAMPNPSSTYVCPADGNSDGQTPILLSELLTTSPTALNHAQNFSEMTPDQREIVMLSDLRTIRNVLLTILSIMLLSTVLTVAWIVGTDNSKLAQFCGVIGIIASAVIISLVIHKDKKTEPSNGYNGGTVKKNVVNQRFR